MDKLHNKIAHSGLVKPACNDCMIITFDEPLELQLYDGLIGSSIVFAIHRIPSHPIAALRDLLAVNPQTPSQEPLAR
ncbi:hypothetical protein HZ326_18159 [Fusarium oxysporum f. sp. albedinis]|nr:hypothetical protein HZ326_18159 [Fusarium oxysporum f. sp. albedinis]